MQLVEDAGMGDEAVVDVLVDAGQVIHAVSAVGGAAGGHAAHVRFGLDVAGGGEIVLHVEADVISGDFLTPGLAEGGGAAAVGQDHHISLMAHQEIIPAVAPAL